MKVALITGASRGIGRATAIELAAHGYRCVCGARSERELRAVVQEIEDAGGQGRALWLDVTDPRSCRDVVAAAERDGPLEVLVNNAGTGVFGAAEEIAIEDFDRIVKTNLYGVHYMTRAALPAMKERGRGHFVNVASVAGHRGFSGGTAYAASKFAVTGYTESLLLEVRGAGIRVTLVSPGSVDTAFFPPEKNREGMLRPRDVAEAIRHAVTAREGALVDRIDLRPLHPPR